MSDPGFLSLLRQHVSSVWALELLLLMRSRPDRIWREDELVRELRANGPLIAGELRRLQDASLVVTEDEGTRFSPATSELIRFCDTLAEAYRTRPVTVINLIASPSQVQGLADAFRFKGDLK